MSARQRIRKGPAQKVITMTFDPFNLYRRLDLYPDMLAVHGHSKQPAVWEMCPVWLHPDHCCCFGPLSVLLWGLLNTQLNLVQLRPTTDTVRPPESELAVCAFSLLLLVVFSLRSFCSLSLNPLSDPIPPHTHKHLSISPFLSLPIMLRGSRLELIYVVFVQG